MYQVKFFSILFYGLREGIRRQQDIVHVDTVVVL